MSVRIDENATFEEIKGRFFQNWFSITSDERGEVEEFVFEDKTEYVDKNLKLVLNFYNKCSDKTTNGLVKLTKEQFGINAAGLLSVRVAKKSLPAIKQFKIKTSDKDIARNRFNEKKYNGIKKSELSKDNSKKFVKLKKRCKTGVYAAILESGYKAAFDIMLDTHKNHNRTLTGKVIVVFSVKQLLIKNVGYVGKLIS